MIGALLIGLQSTLSPPNRNKELSETAVSECQDLPTGTAESGTLNMVISINYSSRSRHILDTHHNIVCDLTLDFRALDSKD